MNFCLLRKEHSGLCDWRNSQKGALRNRPKRKHFLLNVPHPVIFRTPLKASTPLMKSLSTVFSRCHDATVTVSWRCRDMTSKDRAAMFQKVHLCGFRHHLALTYRALRGNLCRWEKFCLLGTQFYLGAHLSEIWGRQILTGCAPSFS